MRAAVHIFVKGGRCVLFIRVSVAQSSHPSRRGSRRSNENVLPHASVMPSSRTYWMRPKGSTTRSLQPDLIQIVRWRLAHRRVCAPARALLQRYLRSRKQGRCQALLAARAPYSTSSNAVLISYAFLILSILSSYSLSFPNPLLRKSHRVRRHRLQRRKRFSKLKIAGAKRLISEISMRSNSCSRRNCSIFPKPAL